jgi:hypothetical protein
MLFKLSQWSPARNVEGAGVRPGLRGCHTGASSKADSMCGPLGGCPLRIARKVLRLLHRQSE